jgi:uncharacterized protein (TIGR03084 family)
VTELLDMVLADLADEGEALDAAVAELPEAGWRRPTPAAGWDVATQIAHLAWTDEAAVLAATDKEGWDALVLEAIDDPTGFVDQNARSGGAADPADVLARWRAARVALERALRGVPDGVKMPWFGPPMSPTSMATARFMETWAHSRDVYDALGGRPEATDRIRHVAHLGVRTRRFAYSAQGREAPAAEPRVELRAPSGETWTWGPEDAAQRVTGCAEDFCLLVTQRVHRADTDLVATGEEAEEWLGIAQCFAGPPGEGRTLRG